MPRLGLVQHFCICWHSLIECPYVVDIAIPLSTPYIDDHLALLSIGPHVRVFHGIVPISRQELLLLPPDIGQRFAALSGFDSPAVRDVQGCLALS